MDVLTHGVDDIPRVEWRTRSLPNDRLGSHQPFQIQLWSFYAALNWSIHTVGQRTETSFDSPRAQCQPFEPDRLSSTNHLALAEKTSRRTGDFWCVSMSAVTSYRTLAQHEKGRSGSLIAARRARLSTILACTTFGTSFAQYSCFSPGGSGEGAT